MEEMGKAALLAVGHIFHVLGAMRALHSALFKKSHPPKFIFDLYLEA